MNYYRQDRHYYQVREVNVLHVNVGCNIINLLSMAEFFVSTDFQDHALVDSEETEFFVALDVVLMSLDIPKLSRGSL